MVQEWSNNLTQSPNNSIWNSELTDGQKDIRMFHRPPFSDTSFSIEFPLCSPFVSLLSHLFFPYPFLFILPASSLPSFNSHNLIVIFQKLHLIPSSYYSHLLSRMHSHSPAWMNIEDIAGGEGCGFWLLLKYNQVQSVVCIFLSSDTSVLCLLLSLPPLLLLHFV